MIGTTLLPHAGLSEGGAHRAISTGPVSHTVNFHDRFAASNWLLMAAESIWAGRGRAHGRCNIFTEDGRLVATYTQDCMVRSFPDGRERTSESKSVM
jgi:acyl-CoA thioesterase